MKFVHLMDCRFVCKIEDGETYAYTADGIIICHPDRKPKYVTIGDDNVTIREIEPALANECLGKPVMFFGR